MTHQDIDFNLLSLQVDQDFQDYQVSQVDPMHASKTDKSQVVIKKPTCMLLD